MTLAQYNTIMADVKDINKEILYYTDLIKNKLIQIVVWKQYIITQPCNDCIHESHRKQINVKFWFVFLFKLGSFLRKNHRKYNAYCYNNKNDDKQLRIEQIGKIFFYLAHINVLYPKIGFVKLSNSNFCFSSGSKTMVFISTSIGKKCS